LRSWLRPAVAAAAILLAGSLAAHQAGWTSFFHARRAITDVQAERGFAFVSSEGVDWPVDTFAAPPRLFEDGRPLGPAPSPRREIRKLGEGRYGLWDGALYFSSSDGTDPRTSGRKYYFEGPWPLGRRTVGLVYLLLGMVVASTLRPRSWLAKGLRWKEIEGPSPRDVSAAEPRARPTLNSFDAAAVAFFCVLATGLFLLRGNGEYPFVWLGSDASQIASFAAAYDHPESFANDVLLADPANYRFYATVHIPLLRWLTRLSGDYGTSFLWLLGPTVFLQLLGFYWLGRVLFADRFWALLLTLLASGTTLRFGPGEFWGLWADSLPRNVFQAVLPFVLLVVLKWRTRPSSWPVIMAGLGALMYLHPVSTPAWAAAIWLGLAAERPEPPRRWIPRLLLSGLVFALVAGTFLWAFGRYQRPSSPALAEQAYRVQDSFYRLESTTQPVSYPVLLELCSEQRLLLVFALAAVVILWRLPPGNRSAWRLTLVWLFGILLVSVGLPLLIQLLAGNPHTTSTQRILIRNLRFLFPLLLIQCVWALAVLEKALRRPGTRGAILACGVLLTAVWLRANPPMLWQQELARRGGWGRSRDPDTLAILQVIKQQTPLTARLLSFEDRRFEPSAIRYFSLRSLAYCYKDVGPLGHTNDLALLHWGAARAKYEDLRSRPRDERLLEAAANFARELGADHLLVRAPPLRSLPRGASLVYENSSYTLLRLGGASPGT
jgi:hypothetical protein